MRLGPAVLRSRVKHSTTEPLRSLSEALLVGHTTLLEISCREGVDGGGGGLLDTVIVVQFRPKYQLSVLQMSCFRHQLGEKVLDIRSCIIERFSYCKGDTS